jgi:hypothetical protein
MFLDGTIIPEAFPTLLTYIGFLSRVSLFMFSNCTGRSEGFHTLLTFIGFFSSVSSFMYVNITGTTESFSASLTFTVFLSTFMLQKGLGITEGFIQLLPIFLRFIWYVLKMTSGGTFTDE